MNIEHSVFGDAEYLLTDYLSESASHHDVRRKPFYIFNALFAYRFVLIDVNAVRDSAALDRTKGHFASIALSVRLSYRAYHVIPCAYKTFKCLYGKVGSA